MLGRMPDDETKGLKFDLFKGANMGLFAQAVTSPPVWVPSMPVNPLPGIAQDHLEVAQHTAEYIASLVKLTNANLALTEQAQEAAKRTETFARRIAWASLWISIGSFLAAALAVGLQLASASS